MLLPWLACRELAEDGQLTQEFRPLYALMRSAAAKPAPASAVDRSQSILEVSQHCYCDLPSHPFLSLPGCQCKSA